MSTSLREESRKVAKFNFLKQITSLVNSIRKQTVFVYVTFLILLVVLISSFDKYSLHLLTNQYHNKFLDVFFKYTTFLGDGIMFGILFIAFLFIRKKVAYAFAVSGILTLLITHLLKKIIFKDIPRPLGHFGEGTLYLVDGVEMALANSFPSGHTTTAFAIFTILCLCFNKYKLQYLCVFLAIIAGVSRVYLSQHYWVDILAGSIIGILIGFISMSLFCDTQRITD